MGYSSLLGSLRSTCKNKVCHFVFYLIGNVQSIVSVAQQQQQNTRELKAKRGWGGLSTGLAVLNVVVDFFKMWCYLIYLLHVFCYVRKHVPWKSSSLNVNVIIAVICLFIRIEDEGNEWWTLKISPTGHKWNMWCTPGEWTMDILDLSWYIGGVQGDCLIKWFGSISYVGFKKHRLNLCLPLCDVLD